jgi:hypothetical protein
MQTPEPNAEIVRRMRPEEKLAVMHALIRQVWELKVAIIRARQPDLPESEIHARAWRMVGGGRP